MLQNGIAEILLYGTIGPKEYEGCVNASDFVKELRALENSCLLINLRINSYGGSVDEGIAIFNAIKNCKVAIDTYIDGIAASMASLIALAGRKVYISKYARLMTHKPSGGAWGNAAELRATADEIDAVEVILNEMICAKTGMKPEAVTAKFLNGKDVFFYGADAVTAKLCDDVYDAAKVEEQLADVTDHKEMWNAYDRQLSAKLEQPQQTICII